jgi:hypothetical protein
MRFTTSGNHLKTPVQWYLDRERERREREGNKRGRIGREKKEEGNGRE